MKAALIENIADDTVKKYYASIRSTPLLSAEEEKKLAQRIKHGDSHAREKLIQSNLRLVVKIASAYVTRDTHFMDIIQEGNAGLIRAAEKFDDKKNVRFSTYAAWWIKQAISRFLSNSRRTIRLPYRKESFIRKVYKTQYLLEQNMSRKPTHSEIAKELCVNEKTIRESFELSANIIPLDTAHADEDSFNVIEYFKDETYNPEIEFMRTCARENTIALLEALLERERQVLLCRFEFYANAPRTLKAIGKSMGISPEAVRQIEHRAIYKLRGTSVAWNVRKYNKRKAALTGTPC